MTASNCISFSCLIDAAGETVASLVSVQLHTVDGADLCRVHVPPSGIPVEATVVMDKDGQRTKRPAFYVRLSRASLASNCAGGVVMVDMLGRALMADCAQTLLLGKHPVGFFGSDRIAPLQVICPRTTDLGK